jgi:hypothetical protein
VPVGMISVFALIMDVGVIVWSRSDGVAVKDKVVIVGPVRAKIEAVGTVDSGPGEFNVSAEADRLI